MVEKESLVLKWGVEGEREREREDQLERTDVRGPSERTRVRER